MLSRSDPDFDQRPEVIVFTSRVGTAVKVSNLCKVPWDILEGSWRLDVVKDPKQERKGCLTIVLSAGAECVPVSIGGYFSQS